MTVTAPDRPAPLADIMGNVAKLQAPLLGILTALISAGYINAASGQWMESLLGLIPGVIVFLATLLGAHQVSSGGTNLVTLVADPAITLNGELISLIPGDKLPATRAPRDTPTPDPDATLRIPGE